MSAAEEADVPVDRFGLVGTTLDRKFHIERLVAEGGFGVVYQGVHITLERPIAIKVLKTPAEYNEQAREAFRDKFALEAKTIARISHPNIVQVLDFGVSPMPTGELAPWMVLEWLTGKTLEDDLQARRGQRGRTPQEAMMLMRPVLEALTYAHDEGIAHRDIKPANIMVVATKRGQTLRLMDFGIAKLMDEGETAGSGATRTRSTVNAFSPQYAAPEQLSGTRSGPWTDVHALALIMTEALTDQAPYEGEDMTGLFVEVMSPTRPTPLKRNVDVGSLEPVLQRALALKPDDRFRNAGEFLAALDASMANATHGSIAPHPGQLTGQYASVAMRVPNSNVGVGTAQTMMASSGSLAVPIPGQSYPMSTPGTLTGSGIFTADSLQLNPPPAPEKSRWQLIAVSVGTVLLMAGLGTFAGLKVREAQNAGHQPTAAPTVTPTVTAIATVTAAPTVATVTAAPTVVTAMPTFAFPSGYAFPSGMPTMMPQYPTAVPTATAVRNPPGGGGRPRVRPTAEPSATAAPRPTATPGTGGIPLE